MSQKLVYLKPNVVIEPLIDSWYAWPHLISPATYAMNADKRHLNIMESYLMVPESHVQAVADPRMRGGPFMDFRGRKVNEVRALKEKTLRDRPQLFSFAKAVRELDTILQIQAKGYSLEALYEKVPTILKGYVELFYDRNNHPAFRFFESLLYRSKYYCPDAQSIAIWLTNNDQRPFCLSTPRLEEEHVLRVNIGFDSPSIDVLSKMRREPQPVEYAGAILGIPPRHNPLFESFFTEERPPTYARYSGDKVRMRYFGHACILIETKEMSVLLDPVISYYGYHSEVDRFSDVDLPDVIDYVLITHNHQDHILFETLLSLRHKIRNLIIPRSRGGRLEDPELKLMFNHLGFSNVIELDEMESILHGDVRITGIPFTGEHSDLNILSKLCYHVQIEKFKLLFMADSRVLEPELYRHVENELGPVDVIFLGMECDGAPLSWLYGPLITCKISREQDGSRRLSGSDCEKGMSLVRIFDPREIYVYAMGQEPWLEFISSIKYTEESNPIVQSNRLIKECREMGMIAERLYGEKEILYERNKESLLSNHDNYGKPG
jgi:L-ascorbate metabolism protein UlaG (beta-lactamase superfamily)